MYSGPSIEELKGRASEEYSVSTRKRGKIAVVAGMIAATGLCIALRCMIVNLGAMKGMSVDLKQVGIAAALGLFALVWNKALKRPFSPILTILVSAALGALIYGV